MKTYALRWIVATDASLSRRFARCLSDALADGGPAPSPPAWWARSARPTPTPTASSILHLLAGSYLQTGVAMNRSPGNRPILQGEVPADANALRSIVKMINFKL
jgi:hypothetical protein